VLERGRPRTDDYRNLRLEKSRSSQSVLVGLRIGTHPAAPRLSLIAAAQPLDELRGQTTASAAGGPKAALGEEDRGSGKPVVSWPASSLQSLRQSELSSPPDALHVGVGERGSA
jgi:hypothetical protein